MPNDEAHRGIEQRLAAGGITQDEADKLIAEVELKTSVARLIANGKMTKELAGQHVADHVIDEDRNNIPDYDVEVVREQLPHILHMEFDENETGCFVTIQDGNLGEEAVPLGAGPPATTMDLVRVIQEHYAGSLNADKMAETAALFKSFKEDV